MQFSGGVELFAKRTVSVLLGNGDSLQAGLLCNYPSLMFFL
jgi:hypothetical protein